MDNDDTQQSGYDAVWGEYAKPVQPRVGLRVMISVPREFYWGPFMRIVEHATGSLAQDAADAFALEALCAWYERNKGRRGRVDPAGVDGIRALVPTPSGQQRQARIATDLEGHVKDEAFSRVVDNRFGATPEGKSLAFREAILEALVAAKDKAPRKASGPEGAEPMKSGQGEA